MSALTATIGSVAADRRRPGGLLAHSWLLAVRAIRSLLRQPAYAAMTLVQPMIWLLLSRT